ncbi:hypothetical protein [Embleya hyalina]|uniref:Uncharacterized protein n=1 Tax=Embleya hyalina TaxID=516124 RepID=A0A401YY83_9ACTN|nr:hypothetical protein [Embleya hyalina]GCD99579.1 hypothetical protein EHYA_07301 [Embleya hyalina]
MRGSALIAPNPDPHHRRPFGMVPLPYPVTEALGPIPGAPLGPPPKTVLDPPEPWFGADGR